MSPKQTDVQTRLNELDATVRGLTQELVEANERIRQLEAALEDEAERAESRAGTPALEGDDGNGDEKSTRQMGDDRQPDEEAGSDLDDIIVA